MKIPRISVRTIAAILIVVALDCVIYRSFAARPAFAAYGLNHKVHACLTMANILAVAVASMVAGRVRSPGFWAGFSIGGTAGILVTLAGLGPAIERVEELLESTGLDTWIEVSPVRVSMAYFTVVVAVPFLIQVLVALACGMIGRKVAGRAGPSPVAGLSGRRPTLRPLLALVALSAVPALAVEGSLRRAVDPQIVRRPAGMEAVVDFRMADGMRFPVPAKSPLAQFEGSKVRVEADDQPSEPSLFASPRGEILMDYRPVRVTLLDGPSAGGSTQIPYWNLRPVR